MITLRNCPMCGEAPNDEGHGVILTVETMIDFKTGLPDVEIGYSARCCGCGASVEHEYLEEAVRLWNGEPSRPEEADA